MINDFIKENLVKYGSKFDEDATNKKVKYMSNCPKGLEQTFRIPSNKKALTLDLNNPSNITKLRYTRGAKSIMNIGKRAITAVDNTSNYDLKPYEQVVEVPDMVAIRRCIKSNLFAVFGEQYGKLYYLNYF